MLCQCNLLAVRFMVSHFGMQSMHEWINMGWHYSLAKQSDDIMLFAGCAVCAGNVVELQRASKLHKSYFMVWHWGKIFATFFNFTYENLDNSNVSRMHWTNMKFLLSASHRWMSLKTCFCCCYMDVPRSIELNHS